MKYCENCDVEFMWSGKDMYSTKENKCPVCNNILKQKKGR